MARVRVLWDILLILVGSLTGTRPRLRELERRAQR